MGLASMHEKLGNLLPKAMCWVCLEMREPLGEVHAFAVGRRGDAMCIGIGHLVLRWEQKEGKNGAWTHLAHRSTRKVECGGWRRRHGGDVGASMDARRSEWDGSSDVAVGDAGKSQVAIRAEGLMPGQEWCHHLELSRSSVQCPAFLAGSPMLPLLRTERRGSLWGLHVPSNARFTVAPPISPEALRRAFPERLGVPPTQNAARPAPVVHVVVR